MHSCEGCVYEGHRKIKPTPTKECELAVVGEAPGTTELAKGEPFVGKSGQVIDRVFSMVNFPRRQDIFLTNALLCRPPKGPVKGKAIDLCRGRLVEELKQVNPKMIIAFGSTALKSLTGKHAERITQKHGVPLKCSFLPNATIVPIYHPAKVLRAPGDYSTFIAGIKYAAELFSGSEPKDPGETKFEVVTPGTLDLVIKTMAEQYDVVGADIETSGLDPLVDRVIDLGIAVEKNKVYIFPEELIPRLRPLFESRLKFIWHNGQFDVSFLRRMGLPARIDHDTILAHYCLNEHEGDHDLDTLSRRELGAPEYKNIVKKYVKPGDRGYESVPKHILWPYLARDCDYTLQLWEKFFPVISEDDHLYKLYSKHLLPCSDFLREVQMNGIKLNREYVEKVREDLTDKIAEFKDKIERDLADVWDPDKYIKDSGAKTAEGIIKVTSPKQVAWALFFGLGLRHNLWKKKTWCVDKEVLEVLKDQHPSIPKILELRKFSKMKSTYVDGMLNRVNDDGRIHSRFLLYGTKTGRLSSRNPNLQNIPRESDIKSIFCAEDGHILIEVDYKAAELRVLAYVSGDMNLKKVFKEGRSLHKEVAEANFGKDYSPEDYVKAKALNFGIAYGMEAPGLADRLNIPKAQALMMIDNWMNRFPQAREYLYQCDKDAAAGKTLVTPFGRKRRFGLVSDENLKDLKNEARNFRIQSIASDLTLTSARLMARYLRENFKAKIVNLVHDSIVVEMPWVGDNNSTRAAIDYISRVMCETPGKVLKTDVPFEVDVAIGEIWGQLEEVK